jgi:hypothetical protein
MLSAAQGLFHSLGWFILILVLAPGSGCYKNSKTETPPQDKMARRDINAVLRDHDDALMAIEGVVGVAVGLLEDGKTICLKVLVVRETPELVRRIPSSLEGYPVVVEETGVIRPLQNNK